ncbi:DUF222 domain-containing protein [Microbacterium sp. NPDC055683]
MATQLSSNIPTLAVGRAMASLDGMRDAVAGLSDGDLVALAARVEHLGRIVDALRVRVAGEVSERSRGADGVAGRHGCRTASELLERVTGASGREVRARIRVDDRTRERTALTGEALPPVREHVAAGIGAGLLGQDAARGILKAVDTARQSAADPALVDLMERHLVGIATGTIDPDTDPDTADDAGDDGLVETGEARPVGAGLVPLSVAEVHAQAWIDLLTAEGVEPDHERAFRNRSLTVTETPSGAFRVNGTLVPEAGALLQTLLSAHTNPARGPRFTPADDGDDDGVAAPADSRSATQKRHDALMAMLEAASRAAETPDIGGAAPTVMIHVTLDDLARASDGESDVDPVADAPARPVADTPTRPVADTPTRPDPDTPARPVARIDGVAAPVPVSVARRLACTGRVDRVTLTADGRILSLESVQRCFTPRQRRAITARDGGCIIPGCTIPTAWCEIHHVHDHARGGPTRTDNGVLLCWWHHHHLDTSGWVVRMDDGIPRLIPPRWIDRDCRPRPAQGSPTRLRTRLHRAIRRQRT